MPLPTVNQKEPKDEFIARCLSSDVMKKEFPNQNKRIAVCFSLYKQNKKKSKGSIKELNWENIEKEIKENNGIMY